MLFYQRGYFAAASLHMKNHRLRMKPQVWVRRAKAEALARKAVTRALEGDPAALRPCLERITAPRRECTVQLDLPPIRAAADNTGVVTAITAAVAQHRALLVRHGAVIGEGRNSATPCVTSCWTKPASIISRHRGANIAVYRVSA
jgi:hypothetical protein